MSATVRLPAPLRDHAGGSAALDLPGDTVAAVLEALVARHPPLRRHLYSDHGRLRGFVNVYRNEDLVRPGTERETTVRDGDVLSIVPSVAGGTGRAPAG